MQTLNLPSYDFSIRSLQGKQEIFDRWRKKHVVLTPEEWVRQNFAMFLVEEKGFPSSLLSIEASLKVGQRNKRTDIVAYNKLAKPLMIVECKAPEVKINQAVFDQIVRYNITLQVPYLTVTNGLEHYCCLLDYQNNSYHFFEEIPDFSEIDL